LSDLSNLPGLPLSDLLPNLLPRLPRPTCGSSSNSGRRDLGLRLRLSLRLLRWCLLRLLSLLSLLLLLLGLLHSRKLGLVHDLFLAALLLLSQHGSHALAEDLRALVAR
jgi:hypothetical protein